MISVMIHCDDAGDAERLIDGLAERNATFTVINAGTAAPVTSTEIGAPSPEPPGEVGEFIRNRGNPQRRDLLLRFLGTEIADRTANPRLGPEQNPRYVRLYVPGPQRVGAYVYVRPSGDVDLRLPAEDAEGYRYAAPRGTHYDRPHNLRVTLVNEEALAEATELAAKAAEIASGWE